MSILASFALRLRPAALVGVIALAAAARASDTVLLFDGTFGAGLVSQKIVDTTPGAGATFTSSTQSFGGPSGDWRRTSHTYTSGAIVVGHFDPQFTHNPAAQPICMIDFAASLVHLTGTSVGGAVSYRLGALQGGAYYSGPTIDVFSDLWASYIQPGLRAVDFSLVAGSGPSRPDFSCTGAPIQFGFLSANSANGGPFTKDSGIDDWTVTLHILTTTYTDGTFTPSDWTSTKIIDTTPGSSATTSSVTQPSGGSPGAYRETTHTWSSGAILVAHDSAVALHDPSIEPVYSIDFSAQLNHLTGTSVGGAVGVRVGVRQGGAWYGGPTLNVFPATWGPFSQNGLTANDFQFLAGGGPNHPDFTSTGTILQFGYVTANSANGGPVTKVVGIDGWTVRANLSPPCSSTVGATACYGDDPGSPCPCFPGVPAGGPGRGCPNSVEPRGALLVGVGNASLANDTVVLQATGMPNSSCLYFQGATFNNVLFGDGKRCVSGQTIRLGTKTNICNASQYPSGSDQPISVKGMITVPGIRTYQVWYRNSAAFCTASTFNLTNSLSINWLP